MRKIIGILICTLMIATALTATGTMNFQTTLLVNENNSTRIYQYTPANSPGLINIKIVAKIVDVYDPDNLLVGAIKVNDTITGKYTYDSSAIDSNPNPNFGEYWYNSTPCGIEVNAGGFVFKTDPNNVDFLVEIGNDYESYGDIYGVVSFNNSNLSNGYTVPTINWILFDSSSTALSNDSLPTTAPVLSKWSQSASDGGLFFVGQKPSNDSYFGILADVTKVTKIRVRNGHFITQPILIWLLEHFANIFPILRQLMKL